MDRGEVGKYLLLLVSDKTSGTIYMLAQTIQKQSVEK